MTRPGSARPAALEQAAPGTWKFSGEWTALGLGPLAGHLGRRSPDSRQPSGAPGVPPSPAATRAQGGASDAAVLDGSDVAALDSVGALLIGRWLAGGEGGSPAGVAPEVQWRGWQPAHRRLLDRVATQPPTELPAEPAKPPRLERIGRATWTAAREGVELLALLGECTVAGLRALRHPARMRWRPLLHHLDIAGRGALPIVGLLSVLMGVVVAYQGASQLRRYGANIFVVDLVAVSMLREFAPLVTAIIVAGRSGAAFAAQLGTMAVTEEIDALRVLGISPAELLVLPKILALFVALPLLTLFSDAAGLVGGMMMARSQLDVGFSEFWNRLPHAIELSTLLVGLYKAPVFAAIVAVVGCFQGLQTSGGADSVGTHTTRAVVQSIFLIIVADALFSVVFSVMDL